MTNQHSLKTALVVGASRGIGLGIVRELLSLGWSVRATERSTDATSALRQLAAKPQDAFRFSKQT